MRRNKRLSLGDYFAEAHRRSKIRTLKFRRDLVRLLKYVESRDKHLSLRPIHRSIQRIEKSIPYAEVKLL